MNVFLRRGQWAKKASKITLNLLVNNVSIFLKYTIISHSFAAIFGLFRIRETSLHGLHFIERLLHAQFIENIVPQNKHFYFECKNKSETHKTPNSLFLIFHQSLEC